MSPRLLQPTLLCEERFGPPDQGVVGKIIATHAPVRGAIRDEHYGRFYLFIATHAPVRGAMDQTTLATTQKSIATHAPVRGAMSW